jgi:hypothetical protein
MPFIFVPFCQIPCGGQCVAWVILLQGAILAHKRSFSINHCGDFGTVSHYLSKIKKMVLASVFEDRKLGHL